MSATKTLTMKLRGVAPLIMNSNRAADPRYAREIGLKAVQGVRKKSVDDEAEILRLKYLSALYWKDGTGPYIPAAYLEATFANALGQLDRGGRKVAAASIRFDDAKLEYGGRHKTPADLCADLKHVLACIVTIPSNKSKVPLHRPIFPEWSAKVTATFHTLTPERVVEVMERAGDVCGIGDWRPRHGRFTVEKV